MNAFVSGLVSFRRVLYVIYEKCPVHWKRQWHDSKNDVVYYCNKSSMAMRQKIPNDCEKKKILVDILSQYVCSVIGKMRLVCFPIKKGAWANGNS